MKDDTIFVKHIFDAIRKIERYTDGVTYASFRKNEILVDAVIRQLQVIGEAARKVSDDFKKQHEEIPWKYMIGMRNYIIHQYFGIDEKIIYETCIIDIPDLKDRMKSLVDK